MEKQFRTLLPNMSAVSCPLAIWNYLNDPLFYAASKSRTPTPPRAGQVANDE
jgi:hypothetical protein